MKKNSLFRLTNGFKFIKHDYTQFNIENGVIWIWLKLDFRFYCRFSWGSEVQFVGKIFFKAGQVKRASSVRGNIINRPMCSNFPFVHTVCPNWIRCQSCPKIFTIQKWQGIWQNNYFRLPKLWSKFRSSFYHMVIINLCDPFSSWVRD